MVFGKGRKLNQHRTTIDRAEIEQTSSFRYLGLILDDQLKLKDHINYVKEKLLKCFSLFFTYYALLFTRTELLRIVKIYFKPKIQ